MLEHGYDGVTVLRIVGQANVGRSTFYEHFESKADIFHQSLEPLLSVLADTVDERGDAANLVLLLDHFSDNRFAARELLTGVAGDIAAAFLSKLLADRFARMNARAQANVPIELSAAYVASGQIALIRRWLEDASRCPASTLSAVLLRSSVATARALLG